MAIDCLEPSPPPKFHHLFAVGGQLVLHVYASAVHRQLTRSVADRLRLEAEMTVTGVPRLVVAEDDGELFWVLEQQLHGSNGSSLDVSDWFDNAVDWLCGLARMNGPPLRSTSFWQSHYSETLECCPPQLRSALQAAWDRIGDVRATVLHGDVQPKNLIFGSHGVGLIDWEGMWLHGLPGNDILFLATMSGSETPATVVPDLLAGRPIAREALLRSALERCGYQTRLMDAALLVTLSLWNLGEARRFRRGPARRRPSGSRSFGDLLMHAAW